jgi:multidrug efflux pump
VGADADLATSVLQQKLAQVEGVGQVIVGGGALPAVRVDVNPEALSGVGLGLEDVRAVLASANANRPKGDLAAGGRAWSLAATDQLLTADEYKPLILRYRNGSAVRLSDVATVTDSLEDIRTRGVSNDKPAILLLVFRQPGANIIQTADRVLALLPQLQASIPPTIALSVVIDATRSIRASVRDVQLALLLSIVLVTIVVSSFCAARDRRIPSVAVPAPIGTFGVMYLAGYSVDNLSLMALTVATGFVVDDAIVVVEKITRHIESGMSPMDAAYLGAEEIGFTVLSISLSLVAVFIPILLMGGIVGRLFREFAVTLSVAVAVSLLVSLTTTPMMCAKLLRPRGGAAHGRAAGAPATARLTMMGRLDRSGERAFQWLLGCYERGLAWVLRHRRPTMLVTLATMAAAVFLYVVVPKGIFPQQDSGRLTGAILADQDTSFQAMERKLSQLVKIVEADPAVESLTAFTGGGGPSNTGRMFVALEPPGKRRIGAEQVIARLRGPLARVEGVSLVMQPVQDLRIGGRPGAAQYQYTLQDEDAKELLEWAPRVLRKLRTLPELADVNTDQQNQGLQVSLAIDRGTASRLGITPQAIDDTLYDAFGQRQVSTMYTQLNQYHVVMEVEPRFWQTPDALASVYVEAKDGSLVPLSAFARWEPSTAPLAVNHQGQFPSVTISFNLPPGVSLGEAVDGIQRPSVRSASLRESAGVSRGRRKPSWRPCRTSRSSSPRRS